jgi:hypothetical protein
VKTEVTLFDARAQKSGGVELVLEKRQRPE